MTRITARTPRTAATWSLALAAASALLLSACAAPVAENEAEPESTPTPTALAIVSIEMPEWAPYPESDPPLSEAESEAKRLEQADASWQNVLATYPDAVRPEVPFEGYVTDENRNDVRRACLEAAGVPIDEGRVAGNVDGPPDTIGWSTSNETEAIGAYACEVAHPTKITGRGPNDAELGWIYDYLTDFYAPCFEANGIEVPEPPGRDVWVETYPGYVWFPSPGDDPRFWEPETNAALTEACPDPDTYLLTH